MSEDTIGVQGIPRLTDGKEIDYRIMSDGSHREVNVYVYRRPNLRCPTWEMMLEVGSLYLREMFDNHKVLSDLKEACFVFPERHLNIVEQRLLMSHAIPLCLPNTKKIDIYTHSVYIIQCTDKENVKIIEEGVDLTKQSWGDQVCALPREYGLMVF